MPWRRKTLRAFSLILLLALFAAVWAISLQIAIWSDRGPATQVFGREIRTPKVRPGAEYSHVNDFLRLKFCDVDVYRWLIDAHGKRHNLPTLHNALLTTGGLGVRQKTEARIRVPVDMPEGKTDLAFYPVWRCNALQRIWPIYGPEEHIAFTIDKEAPPSPPPLRKRDESGPNG